MRFCFRPIFILLFSLLFLVEVFIAKYINDALIRPFVGDALVVILLYFFCKIFIANPSRQIALGVFLFACGIEVLQAFHFVQVLGLEQYKVLAIALGSTFDIRDIIAYFVGYLCCLLKSPFHS